MAGHPVLEEALEAARRGDVDAAVALLEHVDLDERVAPMLFLLLSARRRHDDALRLVTRALEAAGTPLVRSTWTLRRALLLLELERTDEARADLVTVVRLGASEDHVTQAQASLAGTMSAPARRR